MVFIYLLPNMKEMDRMGIFKAYVFSYEILFQTKVRLEAQEIN